MIVPGQVPSELTDAFTRAHVPLAHGRLLLRDALSLLPVSVLCGAFDRGSSDDSPGGGVQAAPPTFQP